MSASPLSLSDANSKLNVELIANGIGTQALHETIVAYRANRRAGTHATKTKATVAGSGKKPWRQKGTGNARSGYKQLARLVRRRRRFRSAPRDYSKKTNKNVKQLALKKALSERIGAGEVFLLDAFTLDKPKTKDLLAKLSDKLEKKISALIILENADQNLHLASRNHPGLETTTGDAVNAEQLLRYDASSSPTARSRKLSARLQK